MSRLQRLMGQAWLLFLVLVEVGAAPIATAQTPAAAPLPNDAGSRPSSTLDPARTPEAIIVRALEANPLTAPYRINVHRDGKQFVLSGRVGSSAAHSEAIREVIRLGYPVRDELVTDTGLQPGINVNVAGQFSLSIPGYGLPSVSVRANLPYVYPPPLFGRIDNPFFGFEPPLVSFPPWWQPRTRDVPQQSDPNPDPAMPSGVELTLDPITGAALLRGKVPTEADRERIGQTVATAPGVSQVINQLEVIANPRPADGSSNPPPPPAPAFPAQADPQPAGEPILPVEPRGQAVANPLSLRVSEAIARRPALAGQSIRVTVRDGVATLSGKASSAYEAMLAFRAAEQTPGIREVQDQLDFTVPEDPERNPLRTKARPEDAESYLTSHIRRQLGDSAHVEPVRIRGDVVEVRGNVPDRRDIPRTEAAIRSIPLLRGFKIETTFLED